MAQEIAVNDSKEFLFDRYERTNRSGGRIAESTFEFFNRSAWRCAEVTRTTLESWFARVPNEKKSDLRGRFRGDNRRHPTALLELVTHEILRSVAEDVQVEPELGGGHPDFSAACRSTRFITECTIAQESDVKFGALQRERVILDAINSLDAGHYTLMLRPLSIGDTQPSGPSVRKFLENWLISLGGHCSSDQSGISLESKVWEWEGWRLHFEAIPIDSPVNGPAIGIKMDPWRRVKDVDIISRSLKKKAERYRNPKAPYLVALAQREALGEPTAILDALFGPERWSLGSMGFSVEPRQFDGFWGSPSQPRNRHVSAVLYKRSMKDAWSICGQRLASDDESPLHPVPEWYMIHNPFTEMPLPLRMLPFAVEYIWHHGKLEIISPANTLNEVLGLPNPWPGEEH